MPLPLRLAALLALLIALFGWNPLYRDHTAEAVLSGGYTDLESGVKRLPNGIYLVRALTRMPGVKADMVRWWFADYLQTTEHYKRWHPTAHVWMDWENKVPGEIIGASHLVHEYIGKDLHKLRIQFIEPTELLPAYAPREGQFVREHVQQYLGVRSRVEMSQVFANERCDCIREPAHDHAE